VNFEAYLISKKIDSEAFKQAEGSLWLAWQTEFEQLHPNSFTSQKLYLINPIRRKYPLKVDFKPTVERIAIRNSKPETANPKPETSEPQSSTLQSETAAKPVVPKPSVPRPVFKQPKPKIN